MPRSDYAAPDSAQRSDLYADATRAAFDAIRSGETIRSVSAAGSTALAAKDGIVLADPVAAGGAMVILLPLAANSLRAEVIVKRTTGGGNTVTVTPQAAEAIDNGSVGVGVALAAINDRIRLAAGTGKWWRID
jgi:hypothetical protein